MCGKVTENNGWDVEKTSVKRMALIRGGHAAVLRDDHASSSQGPWIRGMAGV